MFRVLMTIMLLNNGKEILPNYLKSDPHLQKKKKFCFNNSPSKMMKNAFYVIIKALFVLKIFTFLS